MTINVTSALVVVSLVDALWDDLASERLRGARFRIDPVSQQTVAELVAREGEGELRVA